jgi:uncharacterized membrane protein
VFFSLLFLSILFRVGDLLWQDRHINHRHVDLTIQNSFFPGQTASVQILVEDISKRSSGYNISHERHYLETGNKIEVFTKVFLLDEQKNQVAELAFKKMDKMDPIIDFTIPPEIEEGIYHLRFVITSSVGKDEIFRRVKIKNKEKIFITTDRPLYKPGQTLLFRGMLVRESMLIPMKEKNVQVSITDPKQNILFQKEYTTSEYGIFSGSLPFSEQLHTGEYIFSAKTDNTSVEKTIEVKPFMLPKFEVLIEGEEITDNGTIAFTVLAKHFFGKPLQNAQADISISFELENGQGETKSFLKSLGKEGKGFVAFSPTKNWKKATIIATVRDEQNQEVILEKEVSPSSISDAIHISLIPESGTLRPGIKNIVYMVSSTPDGTPISVEALLTGNGIREVSTNEFGIGKFTITPTSREKEIRLTAEDKDGRVVEKDFFLPNSTGSEGLLLRTKKIIHTESDVFEAEVFGNMTGGMIRLDFVQDEVIMKSYVFPLEEGKANISFPFPEKVFGTVIAQVTEVDFKNDRSPEPDMKVIFRQKNNNLNINISPDKQSYRPGEEMRLSFLVSDENGKPESAAISLKIVDEAFLVLKNDDEILSKTYFLISEKFKEQVKRRNGVSLEEAVLGSFPETKEIFLRALLADVSFEDVRVRVFEKNSWKEKRKLEREKQDFSRKVLHILMILLGIYLLKFFWFATKEVSKKSLLISAWGIGIITSVGIMVLLFVFLDKYFFIHLDIKYFAFFPPTFFSLKGGMSDVVALILDLARLFSNFEYAVFVFPLLYISLFLGGIFLLKKNLISKTFLYTLGKIIFLFLAIPILFLWDNGLRIETRELIVREIATTGIFSFLVLLYGLCLFQIGKYSGIQSKGFLLWLIPLSILTFFLFPVVLFVLTPLFVLFGAFRWIEKSSYSQKQNIQVHSLKEELKSFFQKKERTKEEYERIRELEMAIIIFEKEEKYKNFMIGIKNVVIAGVISLCVWFVGMILTADPDPINEIGEWNGVIHGLMPIEDRPNISVGFIDFIMSSGKISSLEEEQGDFPSSTERKVILYKYEPKQEEYKQTSRARQFLPETVFWEPNLIAENGKAHLFVSAKDSIARWNISALANSKNGSIGMGSSSVITFQDFFLDFDLPPILTKGDTAEIPITLFNSLKSDQNVKLIIRKNEWLGFTEEYEKTIRIPAEGQKIISVPITANESGDTVLHAEVRGTDSTYSAEKAVKVFPTGKRMETVAANELIQTGITNLKAIFPNNTISGTERVFVKIFPSMLSEIAEGTEDILQFPSGGGERTSFGLFSSVMALQYLEKAGKDAPEIRKKAEHFIEMEKQRLLTYETEDKGFSFYMNSPAETVLTAYRLMEFSEMAKVTFVDYKIMTRAKSFLYGKQQNADGSFKFIGNHDGGYFGGRDELTKNSYVIWILSEVDPNMGRGYIRRSLQYLESYFQEIKQSPYALALAANVFLNTASSKSDKAVEALKNLVEFDEEGRGFIRTKHENHYGSYGNSGNIEITALAALALHRSGGSHEIVQALQKYLISQKDSHGSWRTAQATALVLKALTEIHGSQARNVAHGEITVSVNGKQKQIEITEENSVVAQTLVFSESIDRVNTVEIKSKGNINASIQVIKDFYQQWEEGSPQKDSLGIEVEFGDDSCISEKGIPRACPVTRTEKVPVTVKVLNHQDSPLQNFIADIPLPDALVPQESTLKTLVDSKHIAQYEIQRERIILYFSLLDADSSHEISFTLSPRFIGEFHILPARIYEYYNPVNEAFSLGRKKSITVTET